VTSGTRIIRYEKSARSDLRFWALLVIGGVFAWAGLTIDPATNCSESGECAPILVPIAAVIGIASVIGALARLAVNPSSGSLLDLDRGELSWWQNRSSSNPGDGGFIALQDVALLRIEKESEGPDGVHLYNLDNKRQHFFDSEVIPWRYEEWGRKLVAAAPHIKLEVIG
jgi:hypothetical protein